MRAPAPSYFAISPPLLELIIITITAFFIWCLSAIASRAPKGAAQLEHIKPIRCEIKTDKAISTSMEEWKKAIENKNGFGPLEQKDSTDGTAYMVRHPRNSRQRVVCTTNLDESPRLAQGSGAPYITTAVTDFNSLFWSSIKMPQAPLPTRQEYIFNYVCGPVVGISVHQMSSFHLPGPR